MKILRLLAYVLILTQLFFSWNNHLPTWYWFQEVSINLGAYWLVLHLLSIALIIILRRRLKLRAAFVSIVFLAGFSASYFYQLRAFLFSSPPTTTSQSATRPLRVMLASMQGMQSRLNDLRELVTSNAPDVLGLLSADAASMKELGLAQRYPFSKEVPRDDGFGIALYSRYPLAVETQTSIGELLPPIVSTTITLDHEHSLTTLLLHAPQPFIRENFQDHRLLVRRTSTPLRQVNGPLLVFGNFNATEFSGSYKRFRNAGDLKDAMAGYGYLRTWDAAHPLFRLTLDHIMYRDIQIANFQRLAPLGSNHYPIVADFTW